MRPRLSGAKRCIFLVCPVGQCSPVFYLALVVSVMLASFQLLAPAKGKEPSMERPTFYRTIQIDGLFAPSELRQEIFGKEKNPCRLVYGMASLPLGTPVEVEVIFEVAG
jgi:hypothetical protein